MATEAVNVQAIESTDRWGRKHRQVFLWDDRHALAMQDAILAQQDRVPELEIDWHRLRNILDDVRRSGRV
jgi:hypothetical protein